MVLCEHVFLEVEAESAQEERSDDQNIAYDLLFLNMDWCTVLLVVILSEE